MTGLIAATAAYLLARRHAITQGRNRDLAARSAAMRDAREADAAWFLWTTEDDTAVAAFLEQTP